MLSRGLGKIFEVCFYANRLKDDFPPEIVGALGYLNYEPIERIALDYYLSDINHHINYYLYQEACISLLHFPCEKYKTQIQEKIES